MSHTNRAKYCLTRQRIDKEGSQIYLCPEFESNQVWHILERTEYKTAPELWQEAFICGAEIVVLCGKKFKPYEANQTYTLCDPCFMLNDFKTRF